MIKLKVTYKFKGLTKTIKVDGIEVRGATIALFGNKHTDMIMLTDLISVTGEYILSTPSIEELKQRNESINNEHSPMIEIDIDTLISSDRRILNEAIYPAIAKAKREGLKEMIINVKEPESIAHVLRKSNYIVATRDSKMIIGWK